MAALKQYPIVYLVQDNEWDISANAAETRAQDITQSHAWLHHFLDDLLHLLH